MLLDKDSGYHVAGAESRQLLKNAAGLLLRALQ